MSKSFKRIKKFTVEDDDLDLDMEKLTLDDEEPKSKPKPALKVLQDQPVHNNIQSASKTPSKKKKVVIPNDSIGKENINDSPVTTKTTKAKPTQGEKCSVM